MSASRISFQQVFAGVALALCVGVVLGRQLDARPRSAADAKPAPTVGHAAARAKRYMVPVSSSQPSLGPADALVTIVEWCDLPDPACARVEPALQSVLQHDQSLVRLVFRHYGQPGREGSAIAHQFLRAVHALSDKFWQARALLLAHHTELTRADLERYAQQLGLDWSAVSTAMTSSAAGAAISADRVFADMFEVKAVPAIFVNGRPAGQSPSAETLTKLVNEELHAATELVAHGVPKGDVYAELIKHADWKRVKLER